MSTRGARIKRARLRRRLSQMDVAMATDVSLRTIGRIEAGDGENSPKLVVLEDFLGITEGEQDSAPAPADEPPSLSRAMQHLAEAMRLLAQLEHQEGGRQTPAVPARVTFPRSAAPSARRRSEGGDQPARGVD